MAWHTAVFIKDTQEFEKRLPTKPYATDNLQHGLKILPREMALKKRYIELNHPYQINFICFDLDYSTDIFVAEDLNVAAPLYFVQNKKNGHAHLIYGLKNPVCTHANASEKPLSYLKAIIRAYQRRLRADTQYTGLIAKNPCSDFWRVSQLSRGFIELWELAGYLEDNELNPPNEKKLTQNDADYFALGRNCGVFVAIKNWAYMNIKDYWTKGYSDWFSAIEFECECENAKNENPLPLREVRGIANSIARWTWRRFTPESFSTVQRNRVNRRWDKYSKKSMGIERLKTGASIDEIMQELGVSRRTVFNWKSEIKEKPLITNWSI